LKEDREITSKLRNNGNVRIISLKSPFDILNLKRDLEEIEKAVISYQAGVLHSNGVTIDDFGHFYVEGMIPIDEGSRLYSGVVLKGESKIGKNVQIYPHCFIENSIIGDNCVILPGSVIRDSILEENVQVGPYTHLRNGSIVKKGAKMGNFVEMKKSVLGEGSKSMHLTYIGDADVGKNVNIGAGTITCNYDGVNKNKTVIEDGAFIGSGTELVAPVSIRKNSYVGAGSTITEDVPEDSLAIARQKQRNIPGWASRKKKKKALEL
jgi:bifunctional UDP-N-acetylglucosamine pyrophosphorylase / glucosamine-1-phosphate N-acetyltransferase